MGREIVWGDVNPLASALLMPVDGMPRRMGTGTAVAQRVRATPGPAGGHPLKELQGEQEMGRMGRRGFVRVERAMRFGRV